MSMINDSLFYQEFAEHYAQTVKLADQDAYHVTLLSALGRPLPSIIQICGEVAIASMLKKQLLAHGWTLIECPVPFGGKLNGNVFHYQKNQKYLATVFGDGLMNPRNLNFDYVISDSCYNFLPAGELISMNPEMFGLHKYTISTEYINRSPTKLFNCFMSMPNAYRQCWFYEIAQRGLLNYGHVSYLVSSSDEEFTTTNRTGKTERFDYFFKDPLNEIFSTEHQRLREQVPYNNFNDGRMLDQVVVDSKCSIVVESNYTYNGQSYFTEKTFRAIMLPRPFFIAFGYSSPNRIKYLRDCGFYVHDDIIDHSYDNINDPIRQQIAILDQLQKVQDLEYTPALLEELERRAQHNRSLVDQMLNQLGQRYQQVVDKIQSIS